MRPASSTPENGEILGPGIQGELQARSSMVMQGYYNMPEATAAAIDDEGWLHTGDLAEVDDDGYYKITGRLKDMIIRGGGKRLSSGNRRIPLHPPEDFRCSGHRRPRTSVSARK